jgi:queuine tRNA-ribosyltransferase
MLFNVSARDKTCLARAGFLNLRKGLVETPVFMPVGTNGTVKAIQHADIEDIGYRLILGNSYHLYLRPGMETIAAQGGLHKFSSWKYNILTDSGGYQIFSLAPFRKIEKNGVYFRSHIDGAYHRLSPEDVVLVQKTLGSDVLMPLDICTPPKIERKQAIEALETTTSWAHKSRDTWMEHREDGIGQLFGIVQGNFYKDLRKRSIEEITALDLPGIAIGGLSVGEQTEQFEDILGFTAQYLPDSKPHYLMGVGTPEYILAAVENGIDMFDCVFPTRIARNATVFSHSGRLVLRNHKFISDERPIDEKCDCSTCHRYSRSYLRHLFKAGEILGPMLTTHHNLHFLYSMMSEIRENIICGTFLKYKKDFLESYTQRAVNVQD